MGKQFPASYRQCCSVLCTHSEEGTLDSAGPSVKGDSRQRGLLAMGFWAERIISKRESEQRGF